MASTLGKVSLFVYIQKSLIVLFLFERKQICCKNLFFDFGPKFVEIILSILGKRKIYFLNFNLEEFRQGLNWA
jgi:hypothetical protein